MKVIELEEGSQSFEGLTQRECPTPEPGAGQVLVRLQAASLNYRDLAVASGAYSAGAVGRNLIPLSDGGGTVEAVGEGVIQFEAGDRVTNTFSQVPTDTLPSADRVALGSPLDGTLAEYRLFHENGLVHIPESYSMEEAATLPCAGQTAWHTLFGVGPPLLPGQTVLTLGTGGVSSFALLFAKAAGARVIITSSSDDKLDRAQALGADETVNYVRTPDWHEVVLEETDGRGADCIVEVGGAGTLGRSFQAVAPEGKIGLIGMLTHADENPNPHLLMQRRAQLHGIYIGEIDRPQASFQAMNASIEANNIDPLVDRTFSFDEVADAYRYQSEGSHFGKVVISI